MQKAFRFKNLPSIFPPVTSTTNPSVAINSDTEQNEYEIPKKWGFILHKGVFIVVYTRTPGVLFITIPRAKFRPREEWSKPSSELYIATKSCVLLFWLEYSQNGYNSWIAICSLYASSSTRVCRRFRAVLIKIRFFFSER